MGRRCRPARCANWCWARSAPPRIRPPSRAEPPRRTKQPALGGDRLNPDQRANWQAMANCAEPEDVYHVMREVIQRIM